MAFFHQAQQDGTIDKRIKMSEQEYIQALQGNLLDSNAWHRHQLSHKDAKLVALDEEPSKFDRAVKGKKAEEPQTFVNYNANTQTVHAGCQCGQKFEINLVSMEVSEAGKALPAAMKQQESYRKNDDDAGSPGGSYNNPRGPVGGGNSQPYGFVRHSGGGASGSYGGNNNQGYGR